MSTPFAFSNRCIFFPWKEVFRWCPPPLPFTTHSAAEPRLSASACAPSSVTLWCAAAWFHSPVLVAQIKFTGMWTDEQIQGFIFFPRKGRRGLDRPSPNWTPHLGPPPGWRSPGGENLGKAPFEEEASNRWPACPRVFGLSATENDLGGRPRLDTESRF